MVITKPGKNAIRDAIDSAKDDGQLGTDGTAELETDTGLTAAVAATIQLLTSSTADKQITFSYELDSVTGNGNTYKEFENRLDTNVNLNRVVFASFNKTSAVEVQISTTFFIR